MQKIIAKGQTFLMKAIAPSEMLTSEYKTLVQKGETWEIKDIQKAKGREGYYEILLTDGSRQYIWGDHWDLEGGTLLEDKTRSLSSGLLSQASEFIAEFEGVHLTAYADPLHGWKVPTIGYGTTVYPDGKRVKKGDQINLDQALKYLEIWIVEKIIPVLEKIPTWGKMTTNQQTALISFAYNLGANFYKNQGFGSITLVCDSPNRWSDHVWINQQFIKYRNPGSSVESGLRRRREAEAALFCR